MKVGTFSEEMKANTLFETSREHWGLHFGSILETLGTPVGPRAVITAVPEGVCFRVSAHQDLGQGGGDPGGRLETS